MTLSTRVWHLTIRLAKNNITEIGTHMTLEDTRIPSKKILPLRKLVQDLVGKAIFINLALLLVKQTNASVIRNLFSHATQVAILEKCENH